MEGKLIPKVVCIANETIYSRLQYSKVRLCVKWTLEMSMIMLIRISLFLILIMESMYWFSVLAN